ncbi:hypothetical protein [Marinimicrobium sp. ARAG 43.8]|uniref:hypothetical protein n=1 Tax=Marinimicrobium sp. ARAG 43.8 TaxID=3418719 RepID=UPI003CF414E8
MKRYFVVWAALFIYYKAFGDELIVPDFREFPIDEVVYKSTLPEPFGDVKITVREKGRDRRVHSWLIEAMGMREVIEAEDFGYFDHLGFPDISVRDSLTNIDGTIKEFDVSFDYGMPIKIEVNSAPGCSSPCYIFDRSSVIFSINFKGRVQVNKINPKEQ